MVWVRSWIKRFSNYEQLALFQAERTLHVASSGFKEDIWNKQCYHRMYCNLCRSVENISGNWGQFHTQLKVAASDFKNDVTVVDSSATLLLISGCDGTTKLSPVFAASSIRWHHWLSLMWLHICMLRACFIENDCIDCLERISAFGCLSKETSWHPCTLTTHCSCHKYYHVTQLDETPCGWCPSPCEVWFPLTWLEKLVKALLIWDLLWLVWLPPYSFVCHFLFLVCILFVFSSLLCLKTNICIEN